jgi:ribosomal protein L7/L12
MKIENRENVKGTIRTVVFYKNERYVRLQKSKYTGLDMQPVVEWKKMKTNHIVKADKHKLLEDNFKEVDTITKPTPLYTETSLGPAKMVSSGTTSFHAFDLFKPSDKKTYKEKSVDKEIIRLCAAGTKLAAVKLYKDFSGLGLKDSKDYVDALDVQRLAEKKWEEGMSLTRNLHSKEQAELANINTYFKSNSHRKQFIAEVKKYYKDNGGLLQTIKLIKDKTAWHLLDCKLFFEKNIQ